MNPLLPADEDPVVDRYLASLREFSPSTGFEDRVMSRVLMPAPRWLQSLKAHGRSLVETRRVWWLLGGFATTSVISVTVVGAFIAANAASVSTFVGWLLRSVGLPVWRAALGIVAGIAYDLYSAFNAPALSGSGLLAVGGASVVLLTISAWSLLRLMQPARGASPALNATH